MKKKVIIGFPSRGKDIDYRLFYWVLRQWHAAEFQCWVVTAEAGFSARDGQEKVWDMIANHECVPDYGFFMDTDTVPQDDAIIKMMQLGKDVVVSPVWHYDRYEQDIHVGVHKTLNYSPASRQHILHKGVEKVDAASFSCSLISKRVLDLFKEKKESPVRWSPLLPEWFKKHAHNDNIFFGKCKALGVDVWVDWRLDVRHYRSIELSSTTLNKFVANVTKEMENAKTTPDERLTEIDD